MSQDVYVFQEVEQKMITHKCLNEGFIQSNYSGFDYTELLPIPEIFGHNETDLIEEMNHNMTFFNDNGTDYINLVNPATVVWLKVEDSAPEHYLLVETETEEMMQKTFEIGLEANGRESPQKKVELLSNGWKVTFIKELCISDYKFLGFVRYIIAVNETGVLKASFYDSKSGENLKLYYLGEEANGIPKVAPNETNFGKILLPLTTTTTSTTVASTSTSTTSKPTTPEPTKNELPEETVKPAVPAAHGKGEGETAKASGLSLSFLIPIIIVSIIGLLLLAGLIIYCVLRYLRRQKQKKLPSQTPINPKPENRTEKTGTKTKTAENNIVQILPPQTPINPKPENRTEKTGTKTKSAENNIVQIVPPPIQPSTAALTSASISKPEIAPSTAPAASAEPLALEKTQSVKNPSSIFNEFSVTRRDAKYAKRDPRFPELVPGTIEYMVVKGQLDAKSPKTGEFVRSGTVDDSNDAQYVNP
uniref:Uncharacterized protein n=1 Tax=Panagrolaimus sp. ES5 TaxID=591445 RepID=A0AC34G4K8_9BILA